MKTTHDEIADYWSHHQDESGLSVDWAEAKELCWRCAQGRQLQRCHIVPRSLGGSESPSNLVLLCSQCHSEAPNVSDPEFMWVWLRAHAASLYGTYWHERALTEFKFIYGHPPFIDIKDYESFTSTYAKSIKKYFDQSGTHWGQGGANPSTIAWILRQVELEIASGA